MERVGPGKEAEQGRRGGDIVLCEATAAGTECWCWGALGMGSGETGWGLTLQGCRYQLRNSEFFLQATRGSVLGNDGMEMCIRDSN